MYLFTRRRRIDPGHVTAALEWAVEATGRARSITGREIDAWAAVMSPEVGTLVWSFWTESLVEIEAAGDALVADHAFTKSAEKADDHFDGPMVDHVATLLHGDLDPDAPPAGYVAVVEATAANGRLKEALGSGVAIADHATAAGGLSTAFVLNSTGLYGGVAWITGAPDLATLDASEAKLNADPAWLDLVSSVGTDYAAGAVSTIYRRIA